MNILVLHTQVPFVTGGAEVLVTGLVAALRERGHTTDIVSLPLQWNPPDRLLTSALAWGLLDLDRFNDCSVDAVICTKYPTWAVTHPRKILWLVHQHRQVYDLFGTPMSEFGPDDDSREIQERVVEIDRIGIGECERRFAISRNVASRLHRYCGLDAAPLYPPVPRLGLQPDRYDPFILSIARLDAAKRIDRVVEAFSDVRSSLRLVIAGDGPERENLERQTERRGLGDRITFLGRVSDDELRDLYNTCRAVYYAPIDEDYGYSAVEALAAGKPVISACDSGGVLEFVRDGVTGVVVDLRSDSLCRAIEHVADEQQARMLGASGPALTRPLTWDTVVSSLIG
ncbi:MAG: glycosyltransferase family 4 protein [Chloroflexota bacterium]|nr:glycosyltransferase family 4 protein [Chloroflexota bacterium]